MMEQTLLEVTGIIILAQAASIHHALPHRLMAVADRVSPASIEACSNAHDTNHHGWGIR
jgi:hypothetical protein